MSNPTGQLPKSIGIVDICALDVLDDLCAPLTSLPKDPWQGGMDPWTNTPHYYHGKDGKDQDLRSTSPTNSTPTSTTTTIRFSSPTRTFLRPDEIDELTQ